MKRGIMAATHFALGNALYLAFSVYWTFALPRQLSIEAFGTWRLFLLYGSFVGCLHFGSLDALLYRWSRRRAGTLAPALWPVVAIIIAGHVALLLGAALLLWVIGGRDGLASLAFALLVYAVVWNVATALQYALQANRRFLASSLFSAIHGLLFLALVVSGAFGRPASFTAQWGFTAAALASTLMVLVPAVGKPRITSADLSRTVDLLAWATRAGVPILFVNLILILLVNADRIAVSLAFSRVQFATYAFAASMVAMVNSFTSVAARFFVPYMARWVKEGTFERRYRTLTVTIFGAWAFAAGLGFLGRGLIARTFPKYGLALPIAAVMLVGLAFGTPVQVLHLSYARAARRNRESTAAALWAIGVGAILLLIATRLQSLVAVATAGVATLLAWWMFDVQAVLPRSAQMRNLHLGYVAGVCAVVLGSAAALVSVSHGDLLAAFVCTAAAAGALSVAWRERARALSRA